MSDFILTDDSPIAIWPIRGHKDEGCPGFLLPLAVEEWNEE